MKGKYGTIQIPALNENCQKSQGKSQSKKDCRFKEYKGGMYCTQSKTVNRTVTDFPDQEKRGSVE